MRKEFLKSRRIHPPKPGKRHSYSLPDNKIEKQRHMRNLTFLSDWFKQATQPSFISRFKSISQGKKLTTNGKGDNNVTEWCNLYENL